MKRQQKGQHHNNLPGFKVSEFVQFAEKKQIKGSHLMELLIEKLQDHGLQSEQVENFLHNNFPKKMHTKMKNVLSQWLVEQIYKYEMSCIRELGLEKIDEKSVEQMFNLIVKGKINDAIHKLDNHSVGQDTRQKVVHEFIILSKHTGYKSKNYQASKQINPNKSSNTKIDYKATQNQQSSNHSVDQKFPQKINEQASQGTQGYQSGYSAPQQSHKQVKFQEKKIQNQANKIEPEKKKKEPYNNQRKILIVALIEPGEPYKVMKKQDTSYEIKLQKFTCQLIYAKASGNKYELTYLQSEYFGWSKVEKKFSVQLSHGKRIYLYGFSGKTEELKAPYLLLSALSIDQNDQSLRRQMIRQIEQNLDLPRISFGLQYLAYNLKKPLNEKHCLENIALFFPERLLLDENILRLLSEIYTVGDVRTYEAYYSNVYDSKPISLNDDQRTIQVAQKLLRISIVKQKVEHNIPKKLVDILVILCKLSEKQDIKENKQKSVQKIVQFLSICDPKYYERIFEGVQKLQNIGFLPMFIKLQLSIILIRKQSYNYYHYAPKYSQAFENFVKRLQYLVRNSSEIGLIQEPIMRHLSRFIQQNSIKVKRESFMHLSKLRKYQKEIIMSMHKHLGQCIGRYLHKTAQIQIREWMPYAQGQYIANIISQPTQQYEKAILEYFFEDKIYREEKLAEILKQIYTTKEESSRNYDLFNKALVRQWKSGRKPELRNLQDLDRIVSDSKAEAKNKAIELTYHFINGFIDMNKYMENFRLVKKLRNHDIQDYLFKETCGPLIEKRKEEKEQISERILNEFKNDEIYVSKIYEELFQNIQEALEKRKEQIIGCLLNDSKAIGHVRMKHKKCFNNTIEEFRHRIQKSQVNIESLKKLKEIQYQKSPKQIQVLREVVDQQITMAQKIRKQYRSLEDILQKYGEVMEEPITQVQNIINQFQQKVICEWREEKYGDLSKQSEEIKVLMSTQIWDGDNIDGIEGLEKQYERAIQVVELMVQNIIKEELSYDEYIKLFSKKSKKMILIRTPTNSQRELSELIDQFDDGNLEEWLTIAQGLAFYNKNTNGQADEQDEQDEQAWYHRVITMLSDPINQILNVSHANQRLKQAKKQFEKLIGCEIKEKQKQEVKILYLWEKCEKIFEMIERNKLSMGIVEDLKEYINDIEHSILRLNHVKSFETILQFYEVLRGSKNLQNFIEQLKEEEQKRSWYLSSDIEDSFCNLAMIQQKIDESKNRETSFKYDIQQIFNDSALVIETQHYNIKIKIVARIPMTNQDEMQEIKEKIFQMKKLQTYKDKSLLLVTDSRREKIEDEKTINIIELLKDYLIFYQKIEQIEAHVTSLLNYGYDPNHIKRKVIIENKNLEQVQELVCHFQKQSERWIYQVKEIYEKSYILTHFVGEQLFQLIDKLSQGIYCKELQYLFDISKDQFENAFDQYASEIEQEMDDCDSVGKLMNVTAILEKLTSDGVSNEQKGTDHQIQLVTCKEQSEYYCYLSESGSLPKINQILYCQEETSIENIDCFLKRAILKTTEKHYILAVHYLSIEKQQKFCDLLNNLVRTHRHQFRKAQLCFIDRSIVEKVYMHLCRGQLFSVIKKSVTNLREKSEKFVSLLQGMEIIGSAIPGLGKTYHAERYGYKHGKQIKYFPVAGNINLTRLSRRLRQLKLQQNSILIIQIGHIENKRKFQVFLSQIIIFKAFNEQGFQFLPKDIEIFIELENIIDSVLEQINPLDNIAKQYDILKMIKQQGSHYHFIDQFSLDNLDLNPEDQKEHFVLLYLDKFENREINDNQYISYNEFVTTAPEFRENLDTNRAKYLIKRHFLSNLQEPPTYRLYKYWVSLFFEYVSTFSNSIFFNVEFIREDHQFSQILELNRVRAAFLDIGIRNSIQFLEQTQNTNQFQQDQIKTDFRNKLSEFPLLILPTYDKQGFVFVYLDDEKVQLPIKSLKLSQTTDVHIRNKVINLTAISQLHALFHEQALNNLIGTDQEIEIYNFIQRLSNSEKFKVLDEREAKQNKITQKQYLLYLKETYPQLMEYSFTLDNFFKMCLIIQRMRSELPIVLMGESGVGKTALVKFLATSIFTDEFICFNVHAGVNQERLILWAQEIFEKSELTRQQNKRIWVFFDEFNTTDQLSYIKEMIIDRRFQGKKFPSNVVFLAACNPFRRKKISRHKSAGLKKKYQSEIENLAFKVKFPPVSLISVMWDYQQLRETENQAYISKMIEYLKYEKHNKLVVTLTAVHEYLKAQKEISSVSLRDVYRFKEIAKWFLQFMPKAEKKKKNKHYYSQDSNPNYMLDDRTRAIVLSLGFCYGMRLSETKERRELYSLIEDLMGYGQNKIDIQKVLQNQQNDYVKRMELPNEKIALNRALRENVFVILVCIMNKIPVLVVGNPGNSKSLSIRMLASNLRGVNSPSEFCRKLPEFNMVYFQGSEACTSKGILQVFQKVKNSRREFLEKLKDKQSYYKAPQNCIYFDQIGLAEKSVHNPLKVLHSELETNNKEICFIGISNWQLDASKMSRFQILARCTPDLQQLEFTAEKILQSYIEEPSADLRRRFKELAKFYYQFIEQWDNSNKIGGFFGLRDFYCYIKFVCQRLNGPEQMKDVDKIIFQSIATNFDGQPASLEMFYRISNIKNYHIRKIDPIQIVNSNLESSSSRCLLLIIRGDALVPLINRNLRVDGEQRKVISMYGSTFKNDKSSQEYNLQITSLIISHISRGNILAFKDINSSIETSLYDLFNKSFYEVGTKKYCRIAVGANLNPKCLVHKDFNAIVYIDESNIRNTDLAFLNRFEKHYLNLKLITRPEEERIINEVIEWKQGVLDFTSRTRLKKQNFLINCCEESIVTLVIKYRDVESQEQRIDRIKQELIENSTTDMKIAIKYGYVNKNYLDEVAQIVNTIQFDREVGSKRNIFSEQRMISEHEIMENQHERMVSDGNQHMEILKNSRKIHKIHQSNQNLIVFTYDQNLDSANTYELCDDGTYKFRLSSIKGERELRKEIQKSMKDPATDNIHIIVNYERENQHLDLLLFICEEMEQVHKRIIIIIQVSRFSMINGRIHSINISYLHRFKQVFIEDLTNHNQTQKLLLINSMVGLIKQLQLQSAAEISDLYLKSLQCFNFRQILTTFKASLQLSEDKLFTDLLIYYIISEAQNQKVDFEFLLKMKDEASFCANVYEAIRDHVIQFMTAIIIKFTNFIFKESLLYLFPSNFEVKYCSQLCKVYESCKEQYQAVLKEAILRGFSKQSGKISLEIEGNMVPNIEKHCFPLFIREKLFIFDKGEDEGKIQSLVREMFSEYCQKAEGSEFRERILMEELTRKYEEKSWISFEQLKEKYKIKYRDLQTLYIADVVESAFGDQTKLESNTLVSLTIFFCKQLIHLTTIQKIVFLVGNRKIFGYLLQFLEVLKKNRYDIDEDFGGQVQQFDNPLEQLIKTCYHFIEIYEAKIFISKEVIERNGPKLYISEFTQAYFYLQKIRISFQKLNIKMPSTLKICKKLLELFSHISDNGQCSKILQNFAHQQGNNSFEHEVNTFLIRMREQYSRNQRKSIDVFLSLEVYPFWIQNQNEQQVCLDNFIDMCNLSEEFSNNGIQVIQYLFQQFLDLTFEEKWDYVSDPPEPVNSILPKINFKTNFTVALANFINIQLSLDSDYATLKDKFIQVFKQQYNNQLHELMSFEFCKSYLLYHYLNQLEKNNMLEQMVEIDKMLCQDSKLSEQLRLFLLKNLLEKHESPAKLKEEYIDKLKCNWILLCRQFLESQIVGILVPPKLSKTNDISQMIEKFIESQYLDKQALHEIVRISFESSENKFEFLNFLMTNCYNRICPEENLRQIQQEISQRGDLNQQNNKLELQLIRGYLLHQLTPKLIFEQKTKQEQFQETQLFQLFVINFIVSLRFQQCPLIEVFFNMHGKIPENYWEWIEQRFLPSGRQNLSARTLKLHLEANKSGNLHHCSNQCDYIYEISNCQQPMQESICPWCQKIIGGKEHKYTRAAEGARPINRPQMQKEFEIIQQKKTFRKNNVNNKLIGFSFGISQQEFIENLNENQRVNKICLCFNLYMMSIFWKYLAASGNLTPQQIQRTFGMPQKKFIDEMEHYQIYLDKQLSVKLNLTSQDLLIWKMGIIIKLMPILSNYKTIFQPQNRKFDVGLIHAFHRDRLEQIMQKQIVGYIGARQKADLIQQFRNLRQSEVNHSSNLIKERVQPDFYFEKYPKIRLLKLNQQVSLSNFINDYLEVLKTTHPILNCVLDKKQISVEIKENAIIFQFIGKLLGILNFKISRQEASRVGFVQFIKSRDFQPPEIQQLLEEYKTFIKRWNIIASKNVAVTDMCRELGFIERIDQQNYETYPIMNFLPDRDHPQNVQGLKILFFLKAKAEEYNQFYRELLTIIKAINQYKDDPIFTLDSVNSMNLSNFQSSKLLCCCLEDVWKIIENYSSMSVQYGIKTPNYPLNKIQSVVIDTLLADKYEIEANKDKIECVNFVGEFSLLLLKVSESIQQTSLQKINKKSELQNYLITTNKKHPDIFHKYLKKVLGQIEFIMFYCKNLKPHKDIPIAQFIKKSHINKNTTQLMVEPFRNMPLGVLVDLYETIEAKTFDQVFRLDHSYRENLTKEERQSLQRLQIILKEKTERDYLNEFTIALCRFTTRMLFMMKVSPELVLTDWLAEEYFWPQKQPFFDMEAVQDGLRIPISKMGSIVDFFSGNLKKSLEQNLQPIEQVHIRRQEKFEKPRKPQKRRQNLD